MSCCSSAVSHCAPGAPRAAEQQRGRDGVTLALGTGESRSSGVQGRELWAPESLGEMGTEWFSCVDVQCVCECVSVHCHPSAPSLPVLLEPSLPRERQQQLLDAGQERVRGEAFGTYCSIHCPDIPSLFPPGQQRIRICHRPALGREQLVYRF